MDSATQTTVAGLNRNPQWRIMIEEKRNTPEGQDKVAMLAWIADICHGY